MLLPAEAAAADRVHDVHRCRPEDHDEQSGKDEQYEREDDLDRCLECPLLCALTAANPHFLRLDPQHASDRDTELVSLNEGEHKRIEVVDVGTFGEVSQRISSTDTDPGLLERAREFSRDLPGTF